MAIQVMIWFENSYIVVCSTSVVALWMKCEMSNGNGVMEQAWGAGMQRLVGLHVLLRVRAGDAVANRNFACVVRPVCVAVYCALAC